MLTTRRGGLLTCSLTWKSGTLSKFAFESNGIGRKCGEKPGLGNYASTAFNLFGYQAPDEHLPSLLAF